MWKICLGAYIVSLCFDSVLLKGLPSYLKICKRNDPNIRQCISDNIEILRPRLKTGIPELYIPPLDPLRIPQATLNSGDSFKASFKDIELYHTDNFKLDDFDLDLNKYHIDLKISFPELRIKSIYNVNGRILVLNLDGKGPADGNYTNVQTTLSLKGVPFQKNRKDFVRWEKEKININIEKIHLLFERIFGDNAELNDQTNKVINQNIDTIVEELQPVIQQMVSNFVFNIVNRLFAKFSLSELFPAS